MSRRGSTAAVRTRAGGWRTNFVIHHTHLEWLLGLTIMLMWGVIAFANAGLIFVAGAVVFGMILHYVAMETGSHTWLWLATAAVLLYVIVAYIVVLEDIGPLALTVGGASALAYNETVRVNYARRRQAVVDASVFVGSIVAIAVAAMIGFLGIGASVLAQDGTQRTWLWMPAAIFVLFTVAYVLVIVPTLRAPQNSDKRWVPGTRIPPPPSPATPPAGP